MNNEKCSENCSCEESKENDSILDDSINNPTQSRKENDIKSCCKTKNESISSLENELNELKDKYLRLSAEYDNHRKRTQREKEDIYGSAFIDVVSEILPILDNLERANSTNGDVESLKQGIDMVIKMFVGTLDKLGIDEIDSSGEFDPNVHNAVMHIEDESVEKNTIVEVFQKGYVKNGKVIRHSMVKVAN